MGTLGKWTTVGAASVLLSVSLAATPARAEGPSPDLVIFGRQGQIGSGVVDPKGGHQHFKTSIQPGSSRGVSVLVRNRTDERRSFRIAGFPGDEHFSVSYALFTHGKSEDITPAVIDGTYSLTVAPHRGRFVDLTIVAAEDAPTGAGAAIWVAGGQSENDPTDKVVIDASVPPLRIWAVDYKGHFRCTATFPERTLSPGHPTDVKVEVTNLTNKTRQVEGEVILRFRDQAGEELWSTQTPFGGPRIAKDVRPHESAALSVHDADIRWSGPLQIDVLCPIARLRMPAAQLAVSAPGAAADVDAAIAAAVATPGSPFQRCAPGPNGESRTGEMSTPDGRDLPPLTLKCWAEVRRENGFDVVALNLVSPKEGPDYAIEENGFGSGSEGFPESGNFVAAHWGFVVTEDEALPYITMTHSRTDAADRMTPIYGLRDGTWHEAGASRCGYEGFTLDPTGESLWLDWVTGCEG